MNIQSAADHKSFWLRPALVFAVLFIAQVLLHISLLRLPYFWDEAGYYIPAARDFLLTGSLIPHSTPSNAHPPLVMMYLALCWNIAGFTPLTTRVAMIAVSAFALAGVFYLARRITNFEVALASTVCTALYPVFFAQSSLAQLDLPCAGFIFWGLLAYVENRWAKSGAWFALAVLTKETAILAPLALLIWELVRCWIPSACRDSVSQVPRGKLFFLLLPVLPLVIWYAYHYHKTGFVFGNPAFLRYNVQETLYPMRMFLAFLMRAWQVVGYLGLYVLTLSALLAMRLAPLRDEGRERRRIDIAVQLAFLALIAVYATVLSFIGGAVLARYMLPVLPLVIILCISTLRRRVPLWPWVIGIAAATSVLALFVNPPYGFSLEDNLAYRDYIRLHQGAEKFIEGRYPGLRVLTAWPASDEISRSYLGYVTHPLQVFRIDDFSAEELLSARDFSAAFDLALVFSTKYEPPPSAFNHWRRWTDWKTRFFGYHRDVQPVAAAEILGGRLVYAQQLNGQWIGVIEMERTFQARAAR